MELSRHNITLAVGAGSTIDLRGNSRKIFKAGEQFVVYTDILLLDEGVSLSNWVEAPGGIITHPNQLAFFYGSQVLLGNTMDKKLCFVFWPKPHFSIRQSEAFWQYIPK